MAWQQTMTNSRYSPMTTLECCYKGQREVGSEAQLAEYGDAQRKVKKVKAQHERESV